MIKYVTWLLSILDGNNLFKCAVRINLRLLPYDSSDCFMEPENRELIRSLIPHRFREMGPIVDIVRIDEMFEVD